MESKNKDLPPYVKEVLSHIYSDSDVYYSRNVKFRLLWFFHELKIKKNIKYIILYSLLAVNIVGFVYTDNIMRLISLNAHIILLFVSLIVASLPFFLLVRRPDKIGEGTCFIIFICGVVLYSALSGILGLPGLGSGL